MSQPPRCHPRVPGLFFDASIRQFWYIYFLLQPSISFGSFAREERSTRARIRGPGLLLGRNAAMINSMGLKAALLPVEPSVPANYRIVLELTWLLQSRIQRARLGIRRRVDPDERVETGQ